MTVSPRVDEYLARIGLSVSPSLNETGLYEMHRCHAFSIPFENISPFLNEVVSLQPEQLEAKLLKRKRGGYCFEQNGLFASAALALGFDFQVILARVQVQNPEPGPLTHQLGIVKLGGRDWICDVGFGGPSIRYPMPFEFDRVEIQDSEAFRLTEDPDFGYGLQQMQQDGSWFPLYWFRRQRVLPIDIMMGNHFTSTWDRSIFRASLFCALPFPGGKNTLFGRELKERKDGQLTSRKLSSGDELLGALRDKFKIELNEIEENALRKRFSILPA
jgi:N-hydroxyarylamine O-acetyltransferase